MNSVINALHSERITKSAVLLRARTADYLVYDIM